jgi:hypothetical protein
VEKDDGSLFDQATGDFWIMSGAPEGIHGAKHMAASSRAPLELPEDRRPAPSRSARSLAARRGDPPVGVRGTGGTVADLLPRPIFDGPAQGGLSPVDPSTVWQQRDKQHEHRKAPAGHPEQGAGGVDDRPVVRVSP